MIASPFGEVLSAAEFITRCGWSENKMHVAVRRSIVFSVIIEGQEYYPAFLADRRYNVRQIARIIRLFEELPNGSKFQFLSQERAHWVE